MDSVDVVRDDKNYTCTINDVTVCADELHISEEMLGYIMGALNDCGAEITFDGSSCVIEYYDFSTSN